MANAATLCYLLYKVTVSKKQSKNQCFFLTEIGRTQYLINSCFSVPVTANNAGCNIASISYPFFSMSCLLHHTTYTVFLLYILHILYLLYMLEAFPVVPFSGTSKDNFHRIKHLQSLYQLIITMVSYQL